MIILLISGHWACQKEDVKINDNSTPFINKIVYKPGVHYIPESDKSTFSNIDSNSFELPSSNNLTQELDIGSIVVFPGNDEYPYGFMRKITAKEEMSGHIKYNGITANFSETFDTLDFSVSPNEYDLGPRSGQWDIPFNLSNKSLEDFVGGKSNADRIKQGILDLLELGDVLSTDDVKIKLNIEGHFLTNLEYIFNGSAGFIEYKFSNNELLFKIEPSIEIGSELTTVSDKSMELCRVIKSKSLNFCSNESLTLLNLESPPIPVVIPPAGPSVNVVFFFRTYLKASAALQGALSFGIENNVQNAIGDFSVRADLSGLNLIKGSTSEPLIDPASTTIKMDGSIKAEGLIGVGGEIGLSLFDSKVINANVFVESYLNPALILKGGIEGTISDYTNGSPSLSGEVAGQVDFVTDLGFKINSDVASTMGLDPSDWISPKVELYKKTLVKVSNNCGNYSDYSVRTLFSDTDPYNWDCNDITLAYSVNGTSNNKYRINIELPNGQTIDLQNQEYNQEYKISLNSYGVNESDVLDILVTTDPVTCIIAEINYVIPVCSNEEWINIGAFLGQTYFTIQKYNLNRGGNFGEYYDNNRDIGNIYGKLYSFHELNSTDVERPTSFCPAGSVIPSVRNMTQMFEWINALMDPRIKLIKKEEVGVDKYRWEYSGAQYLRETFKWDQSVQTTSNSLLNIPGSGMKIVANDTGGGQGANGFQGIGESAAFWTSTSINSDVAYALFFDSPKSDKFFIAPALRTNKYSCRCIQE